MDSIDKDDINYKPRTFKKYNKVVSKKKLGIISDIVSKDYDLKPKDFVIKTRDVNIMLPKQIAQSISMELVNCNPTVLSEYFEYKERTCVYNSLKRINNYIDTDKKFNKRYQHLLSKCRRAIKFDIKNESFDIQNDDALKQIKKSLPDIHNKILFNNFVKNMKYND